MNRPDVLGEGQRRLQCQDEFLEFAKLLLMIEEEAEKAGEQPAKLIAQEYNGMELIN